MRCLYCNKKLSLLKLAKGDDFCSPEHFDAHQLKLSKDAFQRLMSLPEEEAPKAPLVPKPREEEAPAIAEAPAETAALSRLNSFRAAPVEQAAVKAPPPYAGFATAQPLACYVDQPASIANGPEAGEPVAAAQEVAFPVHDVAATVCILNLYLRLGLAGTEPREWSSPRNAVVMPEYFQLDILRGRLELSVVGEETASEPEPVTESEPEVVAAVETAPAVEVGTETEPEVLAAASIEDETASAPLPVIESEPEVAAVAEAVPAVDAVTGAEPELAVAGEPEIAAAVEAESVEQDVAAPVISIERGPRRTPAKFLVAPSFLERAGTPVVLHSAASSVPSAASLTPILDKDQLPRLDSCDAIPISTRRAEIAGFHLQDFSAQAMASGSEVAVQPAAKRPAAKVHGCPSAWSLAEQYQTTEWPGFESAWTATSAVDYERPAAESLEARPGAEGLDRIDPQQLLAGAGPLATGSLFLGVLETRPLGEEPVFLNPEVSATELGWPKGLAAVADWTALGAAWGERSNYFPLPDPMAEGLESPMASLEAREYLRACVKVERTQRAELPLPYVAKDVYRPVEWPETDFTLARCGAAPGMVCLGSTTLPVAAAVPPGRLKKASGAPGLRWEASRPADPQSAAAKFLPARDRTILPAVQNWPKLEAVPC